MSGDFSTSDMVNRLEPVGFRWIESSTAEQILLGWTVEELRRKSFLDTLHPDDRSRAEATFVLALDRGEALGLVVRMRTAHGKTARDRGQREVPGTRPTIRSRISAAISPTSPLRFAPNANFGCAASSSRKSTSNCAESTASSKS